MNNSRIKKDRKRIIIIVLIAVFIMGVCLLAFSHLHVRKENSEAREFVESMGTGINIGNSLDVCNWDNMLTVDANAATYETTWGNIEITEELIQMIADKGFKTIRIPVTYMNHIDEEGNIDSAWLQRVEEVVDMVLAEDLFCIIDIHHDTGNDGWIKASTDNYEENHEKVEYMIKQIAEKFNSKGDHLILEGFNEMVNDDNNWGNIPIRDLSIMNKWNQLFVDTVRATGGNNADRYLLVNTYAALPATEVFSGFILPSDTAQDKLLVGLHCYFQADTISEQFAIIKSFSKKYNVVIGEWAFWRGSGTDNRVEYVNEYMKYADEYGIPTIWWDNGNTAEMALMDRNNLTWPYEELTQSILK